MVFNVFLRNRDDHSKNFAYLLIDNQWQLSPAYDLTFSTGIMSQHTMTIAGEGVSPNESHLLKVAHHLGIKPAIALEIIHSIKAVRERWLEFADKAQISNQVARQLQKIFNSEKAEINLTI